MMKYFSKDWASYYLNRDLKAFAIQPSLVNPTHYTGESGYVSDTEKTPTLNQHWFSELSQHSVDQKINNKNIEL